MANSEKTPQQKAAETRKANAAAKAAAEAQSAPPGASVAKEGAGLTLPVDALLRGFHARREAWAPGCLIYIGAKGGRGGTKPAFMITGSRAGDLPWKREDDADLLAEDWVVIDPAPAA